MLNIIKMDFYRLMKSKVFLVGLIVSVMMSFGFIAIIVGLISLLQMLGEQSADMIMLLAPFMTWAKNVSVFELIMTGMSALSLLVVSIVAAVFVTEEQQSGYVKNIAGQVKDKSMLVISKFTVLAFVTFTIMTAYAVGATLAGYIFLNDAINFENFAEFLSTFSVTYLLYMAVVSIVMLLCTITKSKSLSIAIGVLFGTRITVLAYSTLGTVLKMTFGRDIDVASIMPDGLLSQVGFDTELSILIRGIVVALLCMTVFLFISGFIMRKRDTR